MVQAFHRDEPCSARHFRHRRLRLARSVKCGGRMFGWGSRRDMRRVRKRAETICRAFEGSPPLTFPMRWNGRIGGFISMDRAGRRLEGHVETDDPIEQVCLAVELTAAMSRADDVRLSRFDQAKPKQRPQNVRLHLGRSDVRVGL